MNVHFSFDSNHIHENGKLSTLIFHFKINRFLVVHAVPRVRFGRDWFANGLFERLSFQSDKQIWDILFNNNITHTYTYTQNYTHFKQIENTRRKSPWLMYWSRCKQGNWELYRKNALQPHIFFCCLLWHCNTQTHTTPFTLECINDRSLSTKRLARGISDRQTNECALKSCHNKTPIKYFSSCFFFLLFF